MENRKITVVLQYSIEVPADINDEMIYDALYGQFQAPSESVKLNVSDYTDNDVDDVNMIFEGFEHGEDVEILIN